MPVTLSLVLSPREASLSGYYIPLVAAHLGVSRDRLALVRPVRRSIDARRGLIKVNLSLEVWLDDEGAPPEARFEYGDISGGTPVVVVGSGPAGLFAALRLIERGLKPIVLERGKNVSVRKHDIAQINRNGPVDPDSNYAFGEGGAGTYSDGKLYTRSRKRGDYRKAFEVFCHHGAGEEILYDAHPHIGTDRLPRIIAAMRDSIVCAGGEVIFGAKVTDIELKDGCVKGVRIGDTLVEGAAVVLAAGHSARDIYALLHRRGIPLEAKPFAMGVRVEHPQQLIDTLQYRMPDRGEYLPAASYTLVGRIGGRGVYSFCMCPGGFIVPAMTRNGEAVLNGMSPAGRNSVYANSGVVTEIRESDFARFIPKYGPLAGLHYQQELEERAWQQVGDRQVAPAQRVADFVQGKPSKSLPATSYVPGVCASPLHEWLPGFMADALCGGFTDFDRKMRGFVTNEAMVLGVESRTSAPVRIPRNPVTLQHPAVTGLFPAGEGAGYAGGIISAAVDGERVADAVADWIK